MTQRKATPGSILDDLMSAAPAALATAPAPTLVALSAIRSDGGTQMRAGLDANTVSEYMTTLQDAGHEWPFPPVVLYHDGETYWLADGFHRVAAARELRRLDSVPADVRAGDRREAVLYAAGANAAHGLRRTIADKRRAVETLLRDADWMQWSDNEIARRCNVSATTVGSLRRSLSKLDSENRVEAPVARTYTTKHGTTATMQTANIGATRLAHVDSPAQRIDWKAQQQTPTAPPKWAAIWELESHVRDCAKQFYADETPAHAAQDMRAAARVRDGGFWNRCQQTPASIVAWRPNDLVQAINNVASQMAQQPPAGRPMIDVLKTADELAADAEAADIASRNAAADEAERQAAEAARQAEREAAAIATTDAAFGVTRHTHLLHVLEQAIEALPEIGDAIGQRQFCLSVVVTLETMQKELRRKMAEGEKAPTPPPAAPATELPADLVAHGWELRRTRYGGRWIAAITPPDEEREITTVKRSSVDDVIGDCRYMERTLKIGAPA